MDPTVTPTELSGASVSAHETVKDKGRFTLFKTEFAGRGGQNCVVYRRCVLCPSKSSDVHNCGLKLS